jgi:ATP-dependent DNA helicase RecQ
VPSQIQPTPEAVLSKYFGYDSFRSGQKEIVEAILNGQDVLAILPTGGGKSICFQVPALILPGLTVVISPLISLMKDQVEQLGAAGAAANIHKN